MISRYRLVSSDSLDKIHSYVLKMNILNENYLCVKDDKLESDENSSLSAFIFAVSLLRVSENWLAITTKHKLIMKKVPICLKIKLQIYLEQDMLCFIV